MKWTIAVLVLASLAVLPVAQADDAHHALTAGEIRRVDKEAKKLTIKHERIVNLDMAAMTMTFQVRDPAILDQDKPGDQVRFRAENPGGVLTVTKVERVK